VDRGSEAAIRVRTIERCTQCGVNLPKDPAGGLCYGCLGEPFPAQAVQVSPNGGGSYTYPLASSATLQHPPDLASDQRILHRFVGDIRRCGAVGEERNAQIVYLTITSQHLAEPVSVAYKGVSSGGKSYTIDRVADFFPPEALIVMTGMSEHALIYWPEEDPFAHRTIILFEATALREGRAKAEENQTAYYVRSLLSEGRIRYPVTTKTKGKLRTEIISKDGPTNLVLSTTAISLHPENETRVLSLQVDDSAAQTGRVLEAIAARRAKTQAVDLREWHELQRWLAGAEHRVHVPFAPDLARAIPRVAIRLRRDFSAVLGLIEAHALLHQANRERDEHGRIVATGIDYQAVRLLVADVISEGLGATVSSTMRETVETVEILGGDEGMDVGKVARSLDLDKSSASRRLRAARERGYIRNLEDRRGKPARYVAGDPLPDEVEVLPRVLHASPDGRCAACGAETAGQGECCSVAVDADPVGEEQR
jgi:DNA-binding transcriptional ArsR family regulator